MPPFDPFSYYEKFLKLILGILITFLSGSYILQ